MSRHNCSSSLPSELPAELLSIPLVWIRRGGRCTKAPTPSSAPSRCRSGPGRRSSPSATLRPALPRTLRPAARCARQPAPPRPTAGQAPRWFRHGQTPKRLRRGQAGIFCSPLGLYTFNGAAAKRSRNRFPTQRGGFCTPGTDGAINVSTAAESAAPADTAAESAALSATPAVSASEDGPLTSSLPSRMDL